MSTEKRSLSPQKRYYKIIIEGKIDPSWYTWLGNFQLISRKEANGKCMTTLSGIVVDQAALRGLVNTLWDLNLAVVSIQQVAPKISQK